MISVLLVIALIAECLAASVSFGPSSYTGIVYRGNDLLVLNSTEGVELRVYYPPETNVQYCESERNETSDNATVTFYAKQNGLTVYQTSFAGATQIVSGLRNLSETYFPYLVSCVNGKVEFLATLPGQIIAGSPSLFLAPSINDCVNRTRFAVSSARSVLNCTVATPAPTFTFAPTTTALPGRDTSGGPETEIGLFIATLSVFCFFLFV